MKKAISSGAEATIYSDGIIVTKERLSKKYRLPQIDDTLRKFRTRREAKVIGKLNGMGFDAPVLHSMCDKKMTIEMEHIDGDKIKDVLQLRNHLALSKEIGQKIAILHGNDIVHGDLTTSNMILRGNNIHFIDFGLSAFSDKIEDKAVDLHLLRQALESKHYEIWEECFKAVLEGYNDYENSELVINRLSQVEKRGRNKGKH